MQYESQHIHFVTGRLAESVVRSTVHRIAQSQGFTYTIDVLPITVAALMTAKWLLRHVQVSEATTLMVVPGYLEREIDEIRQKLPCSVEAGPKDIRDLPLFFGQKRDLTGFGAHCIEILAEINHANRMELSTLLDTARRMSSQGADLIDLGCTPGEGWPDLSTVVRELRHAGIRVSIDSFDCSEVARACEAGAELVLSVNSSNRSAAADWATEVVVIPDNPDDKKSFEETVDFLSKSSVPMRLDPILEPIGCGFAASLKRYIDCRQNYPEAKMLMGIGNLTELTDTDSAGINVLLLGICAELDIRSVLTTQVINWARTSVRECALARQLVHFACQHRIPPKHLDPSLITLRDERVHELDHESIALLARTIKDKNVRIFAAGNEIHAVSSGIHACGEDPFEVMRQLLESPFGQSVTPSHAFYLGFEMAKALTANTLSKKYTQDESLDWGYLTRDEDHHRLYRHNRNSRDSFPSD